MSNIYDIIRRLHETSERAPDIRAVSMRLVRQDLFDELLREVGVARDEPRICQLEPMFGGGEVRP